MTTPPDGRRVRTRRIAAALLAAALATPLVGCGTIGIDGTLIADPGEERPGHHDSTGGHDDASSAHAHSSALALVDPSEATHTAVASGPWSDPATWQTGSVPAADARVTIPEGITVTVDGRFEDALASIGIEGTMAFAHAVDTELRVDTLVSTPSGRLEIGTADRPVNADVTARIVFADRGAIDLDRDPEQLGRGALLHGTTVMYGAERTHRTVLAAPARQGDTQVVLSGATEGWQVGDEIVVTGTQGPTSDETRAITAVDGTTIRFDEPLEQDHVAPRDDLNVYVANATRNIELTSESPEIERRGHVMFMHNQDVDVNHVRFHQLGRTDKSRPLDDLDFGDSAEEGGNHHDGTLEVGERTNVRARYSVHFHRTGTDPSTTPARVNGSVVTDDPGWGFVNHSSHVDFVNNVSWDVKGVGFMTEAGDEIGSMEGNIAIRSVMPNFEPDDGGAIDPDTRSAEQDFGFQGDGFWLQGNRVRLDGNVSAGASAHGFIIWSEGLLQNFPDPESATNSTVDVSTLPDPSLVPDRDQLEVWWAPLGEVTNNESYAATVGFRSRYVHAGRYLGDTNPPPQEYIDSLSPVIDGLTVWGSRDGVLLNYNERLSLRNADIVGTGAPFQHNLFATAATGVGLDVQTETTHGPASIENVRIEGFAMGLLAPRNGAWDVSNLDLANTTDMVIHESRQAPRTLTMQDVEFGPLDGTAVAGSEAERRHVVMDPHFDETDDQPLWFLMPDRVTLDGQGLYFDQQASDAVPLTEESIQGTGGFEGEEGPEDGEEVEEHDPDEDEPFDEDDPDEDLEGDEPFDEDDPDEDSDNEDPEADDPEDEDMGDERPELSIEPYLGLSNRQMLDRFGLSFGGTLIPSDARTAPWLVGGVVGSAAGEPTALPELVDTTNIE